MEIVKKKLGFCKRFNMRCWSLATIGVSHMRSSNCKFMYHPLSASSKSMFSDGQSFGKNSSPTSYQLFTYSLETFRKSSGLGFRLCVKFLRYISKFLEVIDPSVAEIWSFITFYGGFLTITSKLMKPQASFFQDRFFMRPSILMSNFLFISWMFLEILSLTYGSSFLPRQKRFDK